MTLFRAPAREAAAEWMLKIREGEVDIQTDEAFREWIKDRANQVSLENAELAWNLAQEIKDRPTIQRFLETLDGKVAASRHATPVRGVRSLHWRRATAGIAATALLAVGLFSAFRYWWSDRVLSASYETVIGQQRIVKLEDDSVLHLNTATRVRVLYSRRARRVELLSGEAVFVVHKESSRPFIVSSLGGSVEATGTEFDVQMKAHSTAVLVLEGAVRVESAAGPGNRMSTQVAAGQSVEYQQDGALQQLKPFNPKTVRSWEAHQLLFEDASLGEALYEYNRYVQRPVVVGDKKLESVRIHGVFKIGDEATFLDALEHGLHVRIEKTDTAVILYPR